MRIFLVLHPSGNLSVPGNTTWLKNLYEPMLDLGHEIYLLRLDEFCKQQKVIFRSNEYKERLSDYLVEIFKKEHTKKKFDIFFSYLTFLDVHTQTVKTISETGVCTMNFSCNNTHQFYLVEELAKAYEYNLYSEKSAGEKFKKIGANALWFQMAANPNYYYPKEVERTFDSSFVGLNYAKRPYYIKHLLDNGISTEVFGPGWIVNGKKKTRKELKRAYLLFKTLFNSDKNKRLLATTEINQYDLSQYLVNKYSNNFHLPLTDEQVYFIYSKSKINLGFLEVFVANEATGSLTDYHIHLREFEIPMSGGLYCTNYSDELAEFYEPDKELINFRNEHELLDKVVYYLKHPSEADKIRSAGYKRAKHCHTSQIRIENLFKQISFS